MKILIGYLFAFMIILGCTKPKNALVIQTDFGLKDGAVNAMKGVAYGIQRDLQIYDLTHEIPSFNIWEAGYRLYQSAPFWPAGTVFVSVVDPGVGTTRKSIVMKSKTGQFFVAPDNGTLTLLADELGIEAVREIDEKENRRKGSDSSYTFHGRDLYVYTAARLAAGQISFEKVGPLMSEGLVRLEYQKPVFTNGSVKGNIPILDVQYGNVWTNIHDSIFQQLKIKYGDQVSVRILNEDSIVFAGEIPHAKTFGDVPENKPLSYLNSLMNFSLAINMGNFADSFNIGSGKDWSIEIRK
ncbi:MAG TPA: S-adenosyl-l-methionine hydroxide adenosyltransferase family protein [Chitinophagaceae bacterium]|nr:S-adenosyl-l-methionine hydroxide adenosyltransferase family protein [Chitinophagaceae bacterium]